jgi:hypothetical protein
MGLLTSSGLTSTPSESVQTGIGTAGQPYVENVLSKGNAIINNPAPAYTGQLTAGTSDLQKEAWEGLSNLTLPSTLTTAGTNLLDIGEKAQGIKYNPVGSEFNTQYAQQYMNPYLSAALDPQLKELQRQAQINNLNDASKLTQAGAYGGGRQAILMGEQNRNLLDKTNSLVSSGYKDAYDKAMAQFNADQARKIDEAKYGTDTGLKALAQASSSNQAAGNVGAQEAQYGLQNLQALSTAGNTQQSQNQAALNALYNQYLDQRNQPWKNLENQANLVKGLGGDQRSTYKAEQSTLQKLAGTSALTASLVKNMTAAGLPPGDIIKALKSFGVDTTSMSEEGFTDGGFDGGTVDHSESQDESGYTDNPFDANYYGDAADYGDGV